LLLCSFKGVLIIFNFNFWFKRMTFTNKMDPTNTMSQAEPVGNTNPTGNNKQNLNNQLYRWAFTLPCEPDEPNPVDLVAGGTPKDPYRGIGVRELWDTLKKYCKEFYFQLEEGAGGYLHFQGCFSLITKHRLVETKNILGYNKVHLEPVQNWRALIKYCQKIDTRVMGPWDHHYTWIDIITELRPWQQVIYEMIKEPCKDDRKIYWFWEDVGNIGKTAFCKYCHVMQRASIVRGGALKDIAFSLPDDPSIVIFDITRTVECRVNYEAIEACKDGMIFSAKYESKMKVFNSPWVIIFANFEPEIDKLSKDRWEIVHLSKHLV